MRRFEEAVTQLGEQAPTGSSLKRMFAYWERGERAVGVEVYQRAFMAIYQAPPEVLGFAPGAGRAQASGVSADVPVSDARRVELLRQGLDEAMGDGAPNAASLDDWEQLALRYGRATRDRPAGLLLDDLSDDLAQLQRALMNCRTASGKRRLTRVVAQMSGLMLLTLVKLDERSAFRRWARTARLAATEADDPTTQSWVLAQEAYGHYYSADLSEALHVAQHAQVVAGTAVCVGAPLAAALEARAYASRGQSQETRLALDRAEEMVSRLDAESLQPSAFGYKEAQLRFHAGNAFTHLHDSRSALVAQERALELCAPGDYTDWAMSRLDRADCLAHDGDVPLAATEIGGTITSLSEDQRRGIIDLRAGEILASLTDPQRALPVVRDLQDLLIIAHPRKDRQP